MAASRESTSKAIQQSDNSEAIRSLEHSLLQVRADHLQLYDHYERALAASKLGRHEHQTLLAIAEKLGIAAGAIKRLLHGKTRTRFTRPARSSALHCQSC